MQRTVFVCKCFGRQIVLLRPFLRFVSSVNTENVPRNVEKKFDLSRFTIDKIRNFSIIAHVDHGKSTLSDRLLELTGLISKEDAVEQYLDKLQVEKERGITVKAQTVSLIYKHNDNEYLLNLIDTPGHVDFAYEVFRSLSASQGAVLLIDAINGVQAQTMALFNHALLNDITLIPVINKIDMKTANPNGVLQQLKKLFSITEKETLLVSAKMGTNVENVLKAIVEQIPPPNGSIDKPFEALLFDSWFEPYKGVVALIAVHNGNVKVGDKIVSTATNQVYDVKSIGILHPNEVITESLSAGQVGFITANIHNTQETVIGDILIAKSDTVTVSANCPKIPAVKPMLYAGIYPCDPSQTNNLKTSLEKLALTDRSVTIASESSPALGYGFRLGFLGLLHMEVFSQRLDQDFDAPSVITAPSVTYKVKLKGEKAIKEFGSDTLFISNPLKLPDVNRISEYYEPMAVGTIITPEDYVAAVTNLCSQRRGEQRGSSYIDESKLMFQYRFPLSEIITDFYDELKSVTSGYASFDYEDDGYEQSNLVRLDYLLNGVMIEELSTLVYAPHSRQIAVKNCEKLLNIVPRQQYNVAIQAVIGKKVICRENIKPYRKDMTVKINTTGDPTRLRKLLEHQKEGKKRMRAVGKIDMPRDSFIKMLRK